MAELNEQLHVEGIDDDQAPQEGTANLSATGGKAVRISCIVKFPSLVYALTLYNIVYRHHSEKLLFSRHFSITHVYTSST